MTREGAAGVEWNGWSRVILPSITEDYCRLPALGPVRWIIRRELLIFFMKDTQFSPSQKWNDLDESKPCEYHLGKQIANWVVIYSPLQMASDMIENYEGHPAFQFFRDFDADCDWSEALQGEPGEFVAVVRKAKDNYFLGATTNEEARTLTIPLDFLEKDKKYHAVIYADGEDADWKTNPTSYQIKDREVTAADTLSVVMAKGGGQAVSFIPVTD